MLKYCRDKWQANKDKLEKAIREEANVNSYQYVDFVKLVVKHILNEPMENEEYTDTYDHKKITVIDDGEFQGTLLFLIPKDTYQPYCDDYLMTNAYYGSCSGCDTLLSISGYDDGRANEQQVKDYMNVCKDLICNMIKPYHSGSPDDKYSEIAKL